jgi:hypothetical protein
MTIVLFWCIIRDIVRNRPDMAEEIRMADQEPKPVVDEPVKADATKGVRFPEDELSAIEKKFDDDKLKADETARAAGAVEPAPEVDEDASVAKLSEFMKKKGINDVGKLVDIAAEFESKNTKLAQEVARLSAAQRNPAGQGGVQPEGFQGRPVATVDDDIVLPDNPISLVTDPAALKNFVRQLDARAEARIVQREQARTFGDIQARVQAKMDQNPEEFIKLRPIMFDLSKANPQADIDQLYDAAKNQYTTERKSLVAEIKAELGLTGAESEKLKAIVGRVRQAPISGGTGVQVKPAEKSDKDGAELLKAIANADKY